MQNILLASRPTTQWLSSSDFLALTELKLNKSDFLCFSNNMIVYPVQDEYSIPKYWKPTSAKLTGKDP